MTASHRFSIEVAENVRHYRTYTLDLTTEEAEQLRDLIDRNPEGLLAYIDDRVERDAYESLSDKDPADLDDEQRAANVLTVWDDDGGPDPIWI